MAAGKTWTRKVSKSGGYLVLSDPVNPPGRGDPAGEITINAGDVGDNGAKVIYTAQGFTWASSPVDWKDTTPSTTDISAAVNGAALTISDKDNQAGDSDYSYYLEASDGTRTEDPTIHNRK